MKQKTLNVVARQSTGRGPAGRLRRSKQVPAVIYGKSGSFPITVQEAELRTLMRSVAGTSVVIQVQGLRDETVLSVIKELKLNPRTDRFEHLDLQEIAANEEMHTQIPVHLKGEAYGVKNEGAILDFVMHSLHIKCLPKYLPEYVEIDVSDLRLHQAIHINNLPHIEGVTFMAQPDAVVVACLEPKVEEEAPAPVAAEPAKAGAPAKGAAPAADAAKAKAKK